MRGWPVRVLVACAIATSLAASATNGCNDDAGDEPCGSLPDRTACPLARGGSCSDPDCAAVYSCRDGAWALVQRCSPHPLGDAGTADTGDGASCGDASAIDPGSTCASLQLPDCDARILDSCPAKACSTGCTGFLRCTSGEWSPLYVAYCDEDGVLVQNGKKPLRATCGSPARGRRADLDGPNRPLVGSLGSLRRGSSVPVLDALGVGGATTGGRLFFDGPAAVAVEGVLGGGTLAVDVPPVAPGPWGGGIGVRPPTGPGWPPVVGGAAPVAAGGAAAPVATGGAAVVAGAAPVDAGWAAGAAPAGLLLPPERCGDDAPPRLGPETGSSAGPL